jgi:hypothetical protein
MQVPRRQSVFVKDRTKKPSKLKAASDPTFTPSGAVHQPGPKGLDSDIVGIIWGGQADARSKRKVVASGEAAVHAARTRLRPILMTSFSFILGVAPLVVATGAGAEMRQSLGTAVLFGMLGVTGFGLLFTPAFYTFIRDVGRKAQP